MALPVSTRQHDWIKWTCRSVSVIVDPVDGMPVAVDEPEGDIGEQVGCSVCGQPLTVTSAVAPCIEPEG
jgi:hypothetical protein